MALVAARRRDLRVTIRDLMIRVLFAAAFSRGRRRQGTGAELPRQVPPLERTGTAIEIHGLTRSERRLRVWRPSTRTRWGVRRCADFGWPQPNSSAAAASLSAPQLSRNSRAAAPFPRPMPDRIRRRSGRIPSGVYGVCADVCGRVGKGTGFGVNGSFLPGHAAGGDGCRAGEDGGSPS